MDVQSFDCLDELSLFVRAAEDIDVVANVATFPSDSLLTEWRQGPVRVLFVICSRIGRLPIAPPVFINVVDFRMEKLCQSEHGTKGKNSVLFDQTSPTCEQMNIVR